VRRYSATFKAQMVKRMVGPPGISPNALAREMGVSQTQLWVWLKAARSVAVMSDEKRPPRLPPEAEAGKKTWTAGEKLHLLAVASGLSGEELGAFLRREGLHEEHLRAWRDAAASALTSAEAGTSGPMTASQQRRLRAVEQEVKELKRELRRKEKALAEAAALLILEKKLQALGWDERHQHQGSDEDGESDEENEK
jgi:transposase